MSALCPAAGFASDRTLDVGVGGLTSGRVILVDLVDVEQLQTERIDAVEDAVQHRWVGR